MAKYQSLTTTFRPRVDYQYDWDLINEWCQENDSTPNSIINSFLPAIAYALQNSVSISKGDRYILADFGHIRLLEPKQHHRRKRNQHE